MYKYIKAIFILFMIVNFGCTSSVTEKPGQSVLLYRDKDGLYRYDFSTAKEKLIYKLQHRQIFLDEPYTLSGDTLTFGMVGQSAASTENEGVHYYNYYLSVNLKTGENWESRQIKYSTDAENKLLNIKVISIDRESHHKTVSDTTMPYRGYAASYRGISFNRDYTTLYSEHTVGNKRVYSENGSLYCVTKTDHGEETEMLAGNEHFNSKFGNGYLQPQLDPSGDFIICTFMPGFLKGSNSLNRVRLSDKKMTVVKKGLFIAPTFSANGKFILFRRDTETNQMDARESGIYILNLKTLEETQIGKASLAQWAPNLNNQ